MRTMIILALTALAACEDAPRGMDNGIEGQPAEHAMMVDGTLSEMIAADAQLSSLASAINAASLGPTLSGEGPYTLFAPTDRAFAKLGAERIEALLQPANQAALARIISYHVVPGELLSADLIGRIERSEEGHIDLVTARGASLRVSMVDGNLLLGDENGSNATIVTMDLGARNGAIHIIDDVLLPASPPAAAPQEEVSP